MDTKMKLPEWIAWKHPGTGWVLEHPVGEVTEAELLEVIARCNAAPKLAEGLKTYGEHLYKCPCLPSNGQAELEDCTCGLTAILKETKGEG